MAELRSNSREQHTSFFVKMTSLVPSANPSSQKIINPFKS
jgi:hypothetical protein